MRKLIKEADPGVVEDPAWLFNASLEGKVRRALDIHEGGLVSKSDFKALVRQAVALNSSAKSKPSKQSNSQVGGLP
jgi:hypothetical protein